jgi:hippurate hydrolase
MHIRVALICVMATVWVADCARAEKPAEWMSTQASSLVELYQWFHTHPELSNYEEQTAAKLAGLWKEAGFEVTAGVGGHGIVGVLKNGPGPTLMLRTDMDALPVTENTGLVYASKAKFEKEDGSATGVMHACGHDIHMTNLTGVAQYLGSHRSDWSGTLVLVGQPSEERGEGALRMLEDGLFTKFPRPEMALALHCDGSLSTGKIGVRPGYTLANVDSVNVTMHGRGGHGAAPHTTIDPIVQAAEFIVSLQTLVSREMNPIEPAVVTVGSIHGGTKHNIIGDKCAMQLTVRSYSPAVREKLLAGIRRKAEAAAASANAPPPTVEVLNEHTPALYNDDKLVARVAPIFRKLLGDENVVPSEQAMGGEDFSRYGLAGVPVFMYRLGTIEPKRLAGLTRGGAEPPSLHSATYYPDAELALKTGVDTMCTAVIDLLPPKKK